MSVKMSSRLFVSPQLLFMSNARFGRETRAGGTKGHRRSALRNVNEERAAGAEAPSGLSLRGPPPAKRSSDPSLQRPRAKSPQTPGPQTTSGSRSEVGPLGPSGSRHPWADESLGFLQQSGSGTRGGAPHSRPRYTDDSSTHPRRRRRSRSRSVPGDPGLVGPAGVSLAREGGRGAAGSDTPLGRRAQTPPLRCSSDPRTTEECALPGLG